MQQEWFSSIQSQFSRWSTLYTIHVNLFELRTCKNYKWNNTNRTSDTQIRKLSFNGNNWKFQQKILLTDFVSEIPRIFKESHSTKWIVNLTSPQIEVIFSSAHCSATAPWIVCLHRAASYGIRFHPVRSGPYNRTKIFAKIGIPRKSALFSFNFHEERVNYSVLGLLY